MIDKRGKARGRRMPPKGREPLGEGTATPSTYLQLDRIANLLALIAAKDLDQAEQILLLDAAGFPAREIARLVRTTPNTVSVTLYQAKKSKKRKK